MDTKQIAIYAGGFLGSFLVLLAIMYLIYPYLHPEQAEQVASEYSELSGNSFETESYSPEAVDALNRQITNLQTTIDSLNDRNGKYAQTIDSLEGRLGELTAAFEEQNTQQPERAEDTSAGEEEAPVELDSGDPRQVSEQVTGASREELEAISKSLLRMDEDALSPIVNLLEDEQLISIYNTGSSLQREKLLRALEPKKAAEILKKVMS